ncbi:MAG: right-handed parallel beta-helix repeat-containing protein [Phycisphaeraceae bacterium]|nr:MAG: right-handed parallel beta-helix repeat-containing protein [Phycisphaeraceae bacterium]
MKLCGVTPLIILALAALASGPIDPPAGPVQSTMKTLDEVEARIPVNAETCPPNGAAAIYVISQPGSYYLTGDLLGVANQSGIKITTSNVTLDLNGYVVTGVPGSHHGIEGAQRTSVANGVVRAWGQKGILLTEEATVTGVRATGNGETGVFVTNSSIVSDCVFSHNGTDGLSVQEGSVVRDCAAASNVRHGFAIGNACTLENCNSRANTGDGFNIFSYGTARGCEAYDNQGHGFQSASYAKFKECVSNSNGLDGFHTVNFVDISGCAAADNAGHGISTSFYSRIRGNVCNTNGNLGNGAGIHLTPGASSTAVLDNACDGNDWGIQIAGAGNLVVGNTCSSNTTNYDIVANNHVGVITSLPLSGAIGGDVGGNSAGAVPGCNYAF